MAEDTDKEIQALETRVATAQAEYDAARSGVENGESYAKRLESDYREALASPTDFDRLTDLQARRVAVVTVLTDLQGVLRTIEDAKDDADEKLRHETKLQRALEELSPKAQALVQAWKADMLPSRVRLATGEFSLPYLVGEYVGRMRRGDAMGVRREIEDVAARVDLSDTAR